MRVLKTISLMALLGALPGCDPLTQTQYNPAVFEQPQPVDFFCGQVINVQNASLVYSNSVGIGAAVVPTNPYFAGLAGAAKGGTAGIGAAFGGVALLAAGTVPSRPAMEYTVE